jgi:hypothetical protein
MRACKQFIVRHCQVLKVLIELHTKLLAVYVEMLFLVGNDRRRRSTSSVPCGAQE